MYMYVRQISFSQRAAKLHAIKFGSLKKILPASPSALLAGGLGLITGRLDHPQSLTAHNFAVL